jgi:hypothetical protein
MNQKARRALLRQLSELNARWVDELVRKGAGTDEYGQIVKATPGQEEPYLLAVQRLLAGEGVTR